MRVLLLVTTNFISCLASAFFVLVAWQKMNLNAEQDRSIGRQLQEDSVCCDCAVVDEAPIPLKITKDKFGVAEQLKAVLDPYVPVEIVEQNDSGAHVILKLDENSMNGVTTSFDGICEPGGYTLAATYDADDVFFYISYIIEDLGVERGLCDTGYLYSFRAEISCCTAEHLTNLCDSCEFKGRKEPNPPCWSPPDTTPVTGTSLIKVKFLVHHNDVWTVAGLQKELDRANRVIAASVGLPQVRFILHSQEIATEDFGTDPTDEIIGRLYDYAATSSNDEYDILVYVFSAEPQQGGLAGKALGMTCASDGNPAVAMATTASEITVAHELMHTLGAVHDSECNDYILFGDVDSGMGACNIVIMTDAMDKFTCLEVAA